MSDRYIFDRFILDNEFNLDDEFNEEYYRYFNYSKDKGFYLSETDFYPPSDNRVLKSFIKDIDGGDNYADYCRDFFELLDEEDYYE